jgi:hypothetical protein
VKLHRAIIEEYAYIRRGYSDAERRLAEAARDRMDITGKETPNVNERWNASGCDARCAG